MTLVLLTVLVGALRPVQAAYRPRRTCLWPVCPVPEDRTSDKIKAGRQRVAGTGPAGGRLEVGSGARPVVEFQDGLRAGPPGAFIAGQGVHGYIKPDGLFDDLFFYDL